MFPKNKIYWLVDYKNLSNHQSQAATATGDQL